MKTQLSVGSLATLLTVSCLATQSPPEPQMPQDISNPPVAPKRAHVHTEHGVDRADPYYWLRGREDPDVLAYIRAENDHTEAAVAHQAPLRAELFAEMKARLQEDDRSAPVHHGPWLYYTRTESKKSYPIYCRLDALHQGADEQVILDVNALADGHSFFDVGAVEVSPDHRYVAYTTDTAGDEIYTLQIKDLLTGEMLKDTIEGLGDSLTWDAASTTLFYSTLDEAFRPWRIHRHTLGQDPKSDVTLHQEDDDRYFAYISRTRSDDFLIISLESMVTTEAWVLDARKPSSTPRLFQARNQGMEYRLEHQGDRFLIVTNDQGAQNFKLMEAPLDTTNRSHWRPVIEHRPDVLLESVDAFRDHLVLTERALGHSRLTVWDLTTDEQHPIHMPDPSYTLALGDTPVFDTHLVRIDYTSLVTPQSDFDYDMRTRDMTLIKEKAVLAGFDPGHYEARYIFATASDGTKIPISMVFERGLEPDGSHPLLLMGYGAYGVVYDPEFSASRLGLLRRGVIYAIAHIRGGGELGRPWYEAGKLMNKENTFTDFVTCAKTLVEEGWTSPERLAIRGGSAGGLLIGATLGLAPDLFHVAVAEVPFVDVVTTMFDESIPLTATEWEEWGDPKQKEAFDYMLSYSPYDNVRPLNYPHLMVVSGLNDTRVQYWEPTKWVARMRSEGKGDGQLLLKTHMDSGHGGASGRYETLKEEAYVQAFLLDKLNLADVHPAPEGALEP